MQVGLAVSTLVPPSAIVTTQAEYNIALTTDGERVTGVKAVVKTDLPKVLLGYYVIDTTHVELDEVAVWKLYMTQTHVEASFRS